MQDISTGRAERRRQREENMAESPGEKGARGPGSVVKAKKNLKFKLHPLLMETVGSSLRVYKMALHHDQKHKIWEFGATNLTPDNKVIMLVGETGSGKTTLINAIINYIFGVQWEDDYRIQLVIENTLKCQAHSQTSKVNAYQINHDKDFNIPYSVTIIDTPGFGDTNGIKRDNRIVQQLREYFHKCEFNHIDAICCIIPSPLGRLTSMQKYVFNSILSMFGKNIEKNILFFFTFSDTQNPPALEAVTENQFPCARDHHGRPVYFKFNNCVVYANNLPDEEDEDVCSINKSQWNLGMNVLRRFFTFLPQLEGQDLSLTKAVLMEKNALEVTLEGLLQKLEEVMSKQHELDQTQKILAPHRADLEKDEKFEFEVKESVKIKVPAQEKNTNCRECNSTCHANCLVPLDNLRYFCEVFYWNATCKLCGHLNDSHVSEKFLWKHETRRNMRTYQSLKEEYEGHDTEEVTPGNVLEKIKTELEKLEKEVLNLIDRAAESLKNLDHNALRSDPMSVADYIELLICTERQEGREGVHHKIEMLEKAKAKAEIIKDLRKDENPKKQEDASLTNTPGML